MKKFLKRIVLIASYAVILTTANCFAYTIETDQIVTKNEERYDIKTYSVTADEENIFVQSLKDSYTTDRITYTLANIKKDGGNEITKREITTTRQINTDTKDRGKIITELPQTIEYNKDKYLGQYELDTNSLEIVSHYNGYTEYLIEESRQYVDLERNDLDFIPKQITKDGMTLDLLQTDWQVQTTKKIGDTEVTDKYIANCYYAGKMKKDNPYTYTVTATYSGIAEKTEEKPYTYTVFYKMEEIQEESAQENSKINVIPVIGGGSLGLIIVVCFIVRKNTKIYNLQYGHWKVVGTTLIRKSRIDLTRYSKIEVTNRYKIELSKSAINKLKQSKIQIIKGSKIVEQKVNKTGESYIFEVTI